jgi:DNA-binding GntR family transcriptional regulator
VLYRHSKDGIARTSQPDMARRAALSERHVRRVLRRLADAGLLVLVHRGSLRSGPSRYRVLPLAPPVASGT